MRIARPISVMVLIFAVEGVCSESQAETRTSMCSFIPPDSMPPLFTEAWLRWTIAHADAIVRVRVIGLAADVSDTSKVKPKMGEQVAAQVLDVVSGEGVPSTLFLHGTLRDVDLFPPDSIPYLKAGSSPACHRTDFRRGGEHLLILWRLPDSSWTAQGMPHAPSMIQVRGPNDPWIEWVRAARARRVPSPGA